MRDHTPTPWAYDCEPNAITGRSFGAIWSEANGRSDDIIYMTLNPDQIAANAAFIVKAVNSHDALVEALEGLVEAVRRDCDVRDKGISGYTGARLSDAKAALASIKDRA